MGMRQLARSVARYRMKTAGAEQINKKKFIDKDPNSKKKRSYFSLSWRKYLDPKSREFAWFMKGAAQKRGKKKRLQKAGS